MSKRGQRRGRAIAQQRREEKERASEPDSGVNRRTRDDHFSMYHYTTAMGLIGIIENNVIWATHASFLNDTEECRLLSNLLFPQIKAELEAVIPELMARGAFKPEIMHQLTGDAMSTESEKVISAITNAIERSSPIYVASFCMHGVGAPESEHGLLSQWRGYARGGFAIEFDESKLDDAVDIEHATYSFQGLTTRKVIYEFHERAARLENFAGIANASLKLAFEHAAPNLASRPDIKELLGTRDLHDYIRAFVDAVPFLKNASFKEENEYRIVALHTRSKALVEESGDKRVWKEVYFREGMNGAMLPYIKLFEKSGVRPAIKKVIVGPHRDQENQLSAAKLLLEKRNIDVPIVRSAMSLRS